MSGIALAPCMDESGNCIEAAAPNPGLPLSVPGNWTPDEEGFYNLADATVPNAGTGLARFALEMAFATDGINAGQQILFGRVRFRFQGLDDSGTYRVTHPFGVDEFEPSGGIVNDTADVGCVGPPCDFQAATYGVNTAFLRWDPTVGAAAPAGYVGNPTIAHKVIGSPFGTNLVRLEKIADGGVPLLTPELVGETSDFLIQGKLAGPPPPPAAFVIPDRTSLTFSSRQVGTTSPAANITLANHGTLPLTVSGITVGGVDAGDFSVAPGSCPAAVAPGASCSVGILFGPQATGARNASVSIASNALNTPTVVSLQGTGTPATVAGAAPPPVVITQTTPATVLLQQAPAPLAAAASVRAKLIAALTTARSIRLRTVRRRGISARVVMQDGGVVETRLYRILGGGRFKLLGRKVGSRGTVGTSTVRLRSATLRKRLRPGRYALVAIPLVDGEPDVANGVTTTLSIRR